MNWAILPILAIGAMTQNLGTLAKKELNLFPTKGSFTLHHQRNIHMEVMKGHLILSLNLTHELLFIEKVAHHMLPVVDKFMKQNNVTSYHQGVIHNRVMKNRLSRNIGKLKTTIRQLTRLAATHRQNRWIPLISLGLGIANSVGLALLAGQQHQDHELLLATSHRI